MLKKILVLGAIILLASCSTEELSTQKSDKELRNMIRNYDPDGYESPYKGPAAIMDYNLSNFTDDLTLEYVVNIGLAYHDRDNDLMYLGLPMQVYLPSFITNNNSEYLKTVASLPKSLGPHINIAYLNSGHCPVYTGFGKVAFFDIYANTNAFEPAKIYEHGKIHTINYKVKDTNNHVVHEALIKVRFIDDSFYGTPNLIWEDGGIYESTGEQILFNVDTGEIVIANSPTGTPSIDYFDYQGEKYYFTSYTTSQGVRIILDKLEL
ncbi:hypothetical protein [Flavobacterium sp. HSC-61S13]|uniref:hypothetical protein n=1 Tax=Flavobacterium sp. HSC-61S13 TaxID=2910963 RepID=UPI0020A07B54|nr:hypothetical protein [Flavobacterium sp. HSC-61S13]MCP1997112.1 hypothetical protein [Flavobacterium sp. HSC-61S13]